MKISKDKKYKTRLGLDVIIYKIWEEQQVIHGAAVNDYGNPVCTLEWNLEGKVWKTEENGNDLIEVSPYADFKIDDKVLVWNNEEPNKKFKRYFAGFSGNGYPKVWVNGCTSFSSDDKYVWDNCIKYEENND